MPGTTTSSNVHLSEITHRVAQVRRRIEAACRRAGRAPEEVTIIAITKTFPIAVVRAAIQAGLSEFGENRVQELDEKAAAVAGQVAGGEIRWHLVGPLQRNKAKRAVEIADVFHALDSERLARELDKRAAAAGRVLRCFVQVNVSGEQSKFGLRPEDTHSFLDWLARCKHLRVEGLMTLAAPAGSSRELEEVVRPQLQLLAGLARTYAAAAHPHVRQPLRLSMGMSGDFEVAIEEGATDIRLGTILFGER